jgi:hypothetical protein
MFVGCTMDGGYEASRHVVTCLVALSEALELSPLLYSSRLPEEESTGSNIPGGETKTRAICELLSMTTALRFASRKICGRAFKRLPQPYFTAAAEAAVKEEQRRLFPSISHGGNTVCRFSSSNSSNLVVYPRSSPCL